MSPTRQSIAAGNAVFRQGDPTFGLFYLALGHVRLVRLTASGDEVITHNVRPGEFFAEASLSSSSYHCDAVAVCDSDVLVYPANELIEEFRKNPAELWQFTSRLARQVQGLRTRLTLRQIRSARERILQALRLQCDTHGLCRIEGTLKHFAEEIGLTHEALYRALAELERSKAIVRTDNGIVLNQNV
ncbi:hypothetical protein AYR66_22335 [Noviherbaspirillum denitrificans]|uniref:Cyclic nucleotide-binding domain-containing protein n=1 Tax=Noviherbaspirillum denitrificans TaxID=1968433 RepID=A0A254TKG7_9BURK|nr:hypothetical protein AYR66_22335 [Noviherbaspirillum denitrificans]